MVFNQLIKKRKLNKLGIIYSRYKLFDKKWLHDSEINTIIDIGANVGEFTLIFSELFPNAYIFAFEPLPDCYTQLEKNTSNREKIKIFKYALGSENSIEKINASELGAGIIF